MTRCLCLLLTIVCAWSPGSAAAQSADPPEKPALPAISVSVAAGPMGQAGENWPIVVAAVQFPMGRWIRVEGEVSRLTASNLSSQVRSAWQPLDDRRALAAGVNVLFRAGTQRVTGFVGGGAGVHRIRSRFDEGLTRSSFRNGREITVVENRAGLQILGGAEIEVAPRVSSFVTWRGQLLPEPNMGVTAGARVALTRMPARRLEVVAAKPAGRHGQEVRVMMRTGERRTGRFVSLTSSEFVMSTAKTNVVIALRDVRRIEIVTHHARAGALIGLFSGVGWALGACAADDNFCGDDASFPVLASFLGGMGSGIGAAVGGMLNAATADRHVLFEDRSYPVAQVTPILGKGQAGVAVSLRWR